MFFSLVRYKDVWEFGGEFRYQEDNHDATQITIHEFSSTFELLIHERSSVPRFISLESAVIVKVGNGLEQ